MLSPPASSQSQSPSPVEDSKSKPAAQFFAASNAFLKNPTLHNASVLTGHLRTTSADAIFSVDELFRAASELVDSWQGLQLYLVMLQKWPELLSRTTASLALESCAPNIGTEEYSDLIPLVSMVACSDLVDWDQLGTLCRNALDTILDDAEPSTKHKLTRLLVAIFKAKPAARNHLQALAQHNLCKPLEYHRDQSISKFSPAKVSAFAVLLIEFLHVHGSTSLEDLDEAVAYSRREQYAEQCSAATKASTDYAAGLVKICLDLSPSLFVSNLLDDFFAAIVVPELCGAEALVRCLCVTLLVQCRNYTKKLSYPPAHLLEILGRSQRCLYHIFKAPPSKGVGTIIDYLVTNECANAALYCASSQSALCGAADYKDFYLRFTSPQTRIPSMTAKRWISILKTQKIGSYYESTLESMVAISESGIPGPAYVAILKSLAQAVREYPACFAKLRGHLLRKLPVASSSVCEWTVQIFAAFFSANGIDAQLLNKIMMRVSGPGNLGYKKRCINLLVQAASDSTCNIAAWQFLLVLCGDAKASVAQLAISTICDFVNSTAPELLYTTIANLSTKHAGILTTILRKPAIDKKAVHKFVAFLLADVEAATPNFDKLKVASVFISANGLFLPPSKVPPLVQLSFKPSVHRPVILGMLQAALTTKPKIVLSPKIVKPTFAKMLQSLPLFSEQEVEKAGHIVWELCSLGRVEDKQERRRAVLQLYEAALKGLATTTSNSARLQLLYIVGFGARVWARSEECIPILLGLMDSPLRLAAIRVLCRVCTAFPHLFLEGPCHEFFRAEVFAHPQSNEWNQFMSGFLNFLLNQPCKQEQQQKMNLEMLHGTKAELVAESTLTGLYQTYFEPLCTCALSDSSAAPTASRLLLEGILHNKVDSSACCSVVTTMCCSSNVEVSQVAQEAFECLVERKHLDGFVQGLKAARSVSFLVFQRLFEMMHDVSLVFEELVAEMFDSEALAVSVFQGLCKSELSHPHLVALENVVDAAIHTFDGSAEQLAVLMGLRATIQYKQVQDTAEAVEPINPQRLLMADCESLVDELKELSGYEEVFEAIGNASLKRKRVISE